MTKDLEKLMRRVKLTRYKESPPRKLILGIVKEIKMKTGHFGYRAWEMMVEYLAKWLVLHEKTGLASMSPLQGFKGLSLKKDKIYNYLDGLDLFRHYYVAAKAKPWDYIGQVYEMDLELTQPGQNMTPRFIVEMMTKMVYAGQKVDGEVAWYCYNSYRKYFISYYLINNVRPQHLRPMNPPMSKTQLDPCVGTGRFLFIASQMMPKANLVLFGVEINLSLYRACLVNMAMFSNHPYTIICADSLRLDENKSGVSSKLWDLGNQWNPPDISAYYWKPPPIRADAFSLKAFIELKKT